MSTFYQIYFLRIYTKLFYFVPLVDWGENPLTVFFNLTQPVVIRCKQLSSSKLIALQDSLFFFLIAVGEQRELCNGRSKGVGSNPCVPVVPVAFSIVRLTAGTGQSALVLNTQLPSCFGFWSTSTEGIFRNYFCFQCLSGGISARKVQYLNMNLFTLSFNLCANICLCVSDVLTVNVFKCEGFNFTF